MPVIINEVEVIAAQQPQSNQPPQVQAEAPKAAGPTPRHIYWVTRKLIERRVRLQAR